VTLDKNGFPVTLTSESTRETAEKRRQNRSSSRDGPRSRSKSRDGRDLTDEDLSAIKRRCRSSSRERGKGRSKTGSEAENVAKVTTRGRKKPSDLSGNSSHSKSSKIMETPKTNSAKGNNTLEMLLRMPKDSPVGAGASIAESLGEELRKCRSGNSE
jgi:hypothetical protein